MSPFHETIETIETKNLRLGDFLPPEVGFHILAEDTNTLAPAYPVSTGDETAGDKPIEMSAAAPYERTRLLPVQELRKLFLCHQDLRIFASLSEMESGR